MRVIDAVYAGAVAQGLIALFMMNHKGRQPGVLELGAYACVGGVGAGLGALMAQSIAPGSEIVGWGSAAVMAIAYNHFLLM